MKKDIMLFPTLNDSFINQITLQAADYDAFYTDVDHEEFELRLESKEVDDVFCIMDPKGLWTQDDCNFGIRRHYSFKDFQCLFGEDGIAVQTATLGLAIVWTSSESKQRGVIPIATFNEKDSVIDAEAYKLFSRAQLRGEIKLATVIYIAKPGEPDDGEQHLANESGLILGELDSCTVRFDGRSSVFPIFEVYEKGKPLWEIKCDWSDPTVDLFSDSVSININTAHRNYKYLDSNQKTYDNQLLIEIMASALTIMMEKLRQSGYWEQIINGDSLDYGSVGQAVYYFQDVLDWDLSSPISISDDARKFFDKRM